MGKVKITVNPEKEVKNPNTGSSFDSFVKEEKLDIQLPVREVVIEKHHTIEKQTLDKRLRKYARAIRKELHNKAENKSIGLLHIRLDLHSEKLKDLAQGLDTVSANVDELHDKSDIIALQKEMNTLKHHIELIEQEMKIKPVHIKKETIVERFDHRLTLATILMLFINVLLLAHILAN